MQIQYASISVTLGRTMGQAFSECLFHPERLDQYRYQLRTCVRDQVRIPTMAFPLQGSAKRWALGCVNPASWFPLAA